MAGPADVVVIEGILVLAMEEVGRYVCLSAIKPLPHPATKQCAAMRWWCAAEVTRTACAPCTRLGPGGPSRPGCVAAQTGSSRSCCALRTCACAGSRAAQHAPLRGHRRRPAPRAPHPGGWGKGLSRRGKVCSGAASSAACAARTRRRLSDVSLLRQPRPRARLHCMQRDVASRGRDVGGVIQQYTRFVKPSFDQFVAPSKRERT
jgi:hypothetical protein